MVGNRFVAAEVAVLSALLFWSGSEAAGVRRITVFAEGTAVNATGPILLRSPTTLSGSATRTTPIRPLGAAARLWSTASAGTCSYVSDQRLSRRSEARSPHGPDLGDAESGRPFHAHVDRSGRWHRARFAVPVPPSPRPHMDTTTWSFWGSRTFSSYTNPTGPSDPTIQMLSKGTNPLAVTPILLEGATGTNLATRQHDQPTTQNDPDSLKLTPSGDLMLTSGDDGQLVFVAHPGTDDQAVSFFTLLDPVATNTCPAWMTRCSPRPRVGCFICPTRGTTACWRLRRTIWSQATCSRRSGA